MKNLSNNNEIPLTQKEKNSIDEYVRRKQKENSSKVDWESIHLQGLKKIGK